MQGRPLILEKIFFIHISDRRSYTVCQRFILDKEINIIHASDLYQRLYHTRPEQYLFLRLHTCIISVKMDVQDRLVCQNPVSNLDSLRKYTLIIDRIRLLLHSAQHIFNNTL